MSIRSSLLAVSALILVACGPSSSTDSGSDATNAATNPGEVNLYSSRHYDTDLRLYSDFTDQTGIKVNRIEAKSNALIERIKTEGDLSPADLLITVDAGVLWQAEQAGILQPVSSKALTQNIPDHLRHPEGIWFGLSKRARVIIYNKAQGLPAGIEDYSDLSNASLKEKVCMRSSGNIYNISLLSSLIANEGEAAATEWAQAMVDNFARTPQSNDSGQIEAVAAGICGVSLVNTYYLARYARSDDPAKRAIFDSVGIVFPNQDDRGTHVNISGAAVAAHAPNKENAIRFIEYLTSESAQRYFANGNNEYPVINLDEGSTAIDALGLFSEDQLNVGELGRNQAKAIAIYDSVGWQ